jgi:putative membrane protein
MWYLWLKAFHLISIICWFAGLFYLPRLYVYHSESLDAISNARFKIMERKLHNIIMIPAAVAVVITGSSLFYLNAPVYLANRWFWVKMSAIALLLVFHARCTWHMWQFRQNRNIYTRRYFIPFNEIPSVLLICIIIMVVVKPYQ